MYRTSGSSDSHLPVFAYAPCGHCCEAWTYYCRAKSAEATPPGARSCEDASSALKNGCRTALASEGVCHRIQCAGRGNRLDQWRAEQARKFKLNHALVLFVRGYQLWISPLFPASCRYYPTCSSYAIEAIEKHGAAAGSWLAIRRIARCHPFRPGGFDPVP